MTMTDSAYPNICDAFPDGEFGAWRTGRRRATTITMSPEKLGEFIAYIDALVELVQRSQPLASPATEHDAWEDWHRDRELLVFKACLP